MFTTDRPTGLRVAYDQAFLLYPRWRGWPTALLLALAVATKVTPVLILAVMVVYFRDWRLALKALAALLWLCPSSRVHVGLYREFIFTTLPSIAVEGPTRRSSTRRCCASGGSTRWC